MPPRLAKLLAILVAAALIGGAFWLRGRNDSGGNDGGDDGATPSGSLKIVCVTELADVCTALEAEIEDVAVEIAEAGTTADALTSLDGPPLFDAWVTLDPWPDMVDIDRELDQRSGLFDETPAAASMPLAILTFSDVAGDLGCGKEVTWSCLGDEAGPQVRVAIPPADSALGILVAGQAASSFLETTEFDRDNIRESSFQSWLDRLLGTSRVSDAPTAMLQQGQGAFVAAGTTRRAAQAAAASERGQQQDMLVVNPDRAVSIRVVVAPLVSGDRADRAVRLLTGNTGKATLGQNGWKVPAADGGSGLPDAGVLVALREEIK